MTKEDKPGKKRKRAGSPALATRKKAKAPEKNGTKGSRAKKSKAAVASQENAGEGPKVEGEQGAEECEPRGSKEPTACAYCHSTPNVANENEKAALESDPEALKFCEWCQKLQKTFFNNNGSPPKEEEMTSVDTLFTTVEDYKNMNIDYLTWSKIGKVMRHINLLEAYKVPRDDEFKFRDRAKGLVDKWYQILKLNSHLQFSRHR
ncbi:hypothetical protein B0H11DRAFT_2234518 [Mycena galericulata]|nr:hypothetical protein B0H11DRAFT_1921520 [Mycena galericulata]KAJ7477853.1 hypothetical protein B0H11DRAFT_2234518 [Mycena galericulata]